MRAFVYFIFSLTGFITWTALPLPSKAKYLSGIESKKQDVWKYREWVVPVTLFNSLGPPVFPSIDTSYSSRRQSTYTEQVKELPPRYSIGSLEVFSNKTNFANDREHLFTFDLGNPGQTIFLTEKCKGCQSDIEPFSGCPKIVPTCENRDTDFFCWPSHPHQYLPLDSVFFVEKSCPYKNGKSENAGTLDNVPICIACFDGGDHSRFYAFAQTNFKFIGATQVITKNGTSVEAPAPMIENFNFGALVRTVPLRDRIWSNIGIGANSSFMNQLPAHSFMFDFDYYGVKKTREQVIFNPNPNIYSQWAKSPYIIQHHRHHNIERLNFGSNNQKSPTNIDFFMDTGNDGISISDEDLLDFLESVTGGAWLEDHSDPNSYGESRLFVPYERNLAPDLNIWMSPGILVTLPSYAWVFKNSQPGEVGKNPTIFVKDTDNILGLPFLSAPGYSFVFEDLENLLYIKYEHYEAQPSILAN